MATSTDVNHLLCTVRLKGDAGTALALETWQVGVRFAMTGINALAKDAGRTLLATRSVSDAIVSRTITDYAVQQGFAGVSGPLGETITDADQDALVRGAHDFLVAISGYLFNGYDLESIRLYPCGADGRSRTAPSVYTPTTATMNPTVGQSLPADVAAAISTATATRGVKGRGRIFLGGLGQASMAATGTPTGPFRTAALNGLKAWMDSARALGDPTGRLAYSPIVWHRSGDLAGVETGEYGSPISAVRMDDRYDTQRRRDKRVSRTWQTASLA